MSPAQNSKQTLWSLSWGLFPRRVTIYLKEKGIQDHFNIIPLEVGPQGLRQPPGKPAGSVPIHELAPASEDEPNHGQYIFQSISILEYLEDVYGPGSATPNMRGDTAIERARVRDCLSIVSEATDCFGLYVHSASKFFEFAGESSVDAAKKCIGRAHQQLELLDRHSDSVGPWLASSGDRPTIVDCVAMSTVQFAWHVYGYDLTEGHPALKRMYDAFIVRDSSEMAPVPDFVKEMCPVLSVR